MMLMIFVVFLLWRGFSFFGFIEVVANGSGFKVDRSNYGCSYSVANNDIYNYWHEVFGSI